MSDMKDVPSILNSRRRLRPEGMLYFSDRGQAAEGGCGVIGMACSEAIAGRHMLQALDQMRNRGNGKGGGIAAVGLNPEQFGVSSEVLANDYLLVIAYLEPDCRLEVESRFIESIFDVDYVREAPHLADFREIPGLEVRPPDVVQYFVRVKADVAEAFARDHKLHLEQSALEDELVYQNSVALNQTFYASTGSTRAFVLSHGKDLLVMKMVGYGDDVIRYYQLEEVRAHVWIGHHRYPTKGRVWHPGGAHPFIGLNEALVHNGDFANYASIAEYLAQRHIYPLFLTDTEVSVQVFDLLHRTYDYPLEYVIEALAPTTERDFHLLPPDKQEVYLALQKTHMHCSPDGPWFFLIAQSDTDGARPAQRLIGITDTSMLRPQVFAWQQHSPNGPAIGFAASEKQGIDAALASLAAEDSRFWSRADSYWNARGGSHTDGGAFIFSYYPREGKLACTDKFGRTIGLEMTSTPYRANGHKAAPINMPETGADAMYRWAVERIPTWTYEQVLDFLHTLEGLAKRSGTGQMALSVLTRLMDRRYPTGGLRRSSLLSLYDQSLSRMLDLLPGVAGSGITRSTRFDPAPGPGTADLTICLEAHGFEPEGKDSLAHEIARLHRLGYRRFIVTGARGHRFIGSGLGPGASGVHIDVYGSSGDYLASGIDGVEIQVHNNGQDQLAQIMRSGKLVVHGDVGQTFMYGAKGGEAYIFGNAAGRPLINAVGRPRVVINGTCLDYLAESFMAGDATNGGGFVILNGVRQDASGRLEELPSPYPGGNLFSLASGGAIFIRDPRGQVKADQLNGGDFSPLTDHEWRQVLPYLQENERLFGIRVEDLLVVDGQRKPPAEVYRMIRPAKLRALQAEEAWVVKH